MSDGAAAEATAMDVTALPTDPPALPAPATVAAGGSDGDAANPDVAAIAKDRGVRAADAKGESLCQAKEKVALPPAASIFRVVSPGAGVDSGIGRARAGQLLDVPTPMFVICTTRGLPLHLKPRDICAQLPGRQLFALPIGDLLCQSLSVAQCPDKQLGCAGFWRFLQSHLTYCSFRNPHYEVSVHCSDVICTVESLCGRRKAGPKDVLELQRLMRTHLVAAPAEEMTTEAVNTRRLDRSIVRTEAWLREILEAKAQEPELGFEWHVLAGVQGGGDVKAREKACIKASAMPVAGFWVGGLGYTEELTTRAKILDVVTSTLPSAQPRFLPLSGGSPIEVLQAVLLGVDVIEVLYPFTMGAKGVALVFDCDMPEDYCMGEEDEALLRALLPPHEGSDDIRPLPELPKTVRQLQLFSDEWREDFTPISESSPVQQHTRAYLHHLIKVREMLGTILLSQHNVDAYSRFFVALRRHALEGSVARFAAWFLRTQTANVDEPAAAQRFDGAKRFKRN
eukprot:NODE_4651_length_1865_cov_6.140967.p1 GENE.NODE_4651_length_1865_cov_6.140967~~NODE_4651_length_1865_cov_6.140967.p1  ORF type:complete len:510 (-),score=142.21 NODE_4651_length_1865_cov_6.140967:249-1778(-)